MTLGYNFVATTATAFAVVTLLLDRFVASRNIKYTPIRARLLSSPMPSHIEGFKCSGKCWVRSDIPDILFGKAKKLTDFGW